MVHPPAIGPAVKSPQKGRPTNLRDLNCHPVDEEVVPDPCQIVQGAARNIGEPASLALGGDAAHEQVSLRTSPQTPSQAEGPCLVVAGRPLELSTVDGEPPFGSASDDWAKSGPEQDS